MIKTIRGKEHKFNIKDSLVVIILLSSLVMGVILAGNFDNIISGFEYMFKSQYGLVNDYIMFAGPGAALVNASLTTIIFYAAVRLLKRDLSDIDFAGMLTVFGFAVLGKNIFASLPILAGAFITAWFDKKKMDSYITVAIFATALSPVIMFVWNYFPKHFGMDQSVAYVVGSAVGILVTFLTVYLAKLAPSFHKGLTLYNVGFTSGLVAVIVNGIMNVFGIKAKDHALTAGADIAKVITETQINELKYIFLIWFLVLGLIAIGLAIYSSTGKIKDMLQIMNHSGRTPKFGEETNNAAVMMNIGILFILGTLVVFFLGSTFEAIAFAGVFTFAGFGAYGKHPKNVFPVVLGIMLAWVIIGLTSANGIQSIYGNRTMMGAILFGSALAPVSGVYGFSLGVIAGFLHVSIVNQVLNFHVFTLYHNGFATGMVAFIMQGIAIIVHREDRLLSPLPNSKVEK